LPYTLMKRIYPYCYALLLLALLAACAPLAENRPAQETPTQPRLPTAVIAAPTRIPAPLPTTAPPVRTPAPLPTTPPAPTAPPAPTEVPPPTRVPLPTAPAVARNGQIRLGTYFFYWYDCPRNECDAGQLSAVPPGWTGPLPGDHDPRDGRSYSSLNED